MPETNLYNIKEKPYNQLILDFPVVGLYRFRMEQLKGIDLQSGLPANKDLAGHIKVENALTDINTVKLIDNLVTPVVGQYDQFAQVDDQTRKKFKDPQKLNYPALRSLWVNRQKKHEFNPMHDHNGVYSFVLWYNIPYTVEEEIDASPFKGSPEHNKSGQFEFYTSMKDHRFIELAHSSDWNGTLAVFPADTPHCVYPFYSTDEERVTIAGNYYYIPNQ